MLSIEAFAGVNLMMNLVILSVSARCIGYVRWPRVILASILGTAYAIAAYTWDSWLRSAAAQAICLLFMALVAGGGCARRKRWRSCLYVSGSTIFAGGVMTLLSRWQASGGWQLTVIGAATIAVTAFLSDGLRAKWQEESRVRLRIATRMGSAEVEALVDTGNRLREPLSGLPVVVVGKRALEGILDRSCLVGTGGRLLPGFRLVYYGAVGGNGEMQCFRPESVCIWRGSRWQEAPDVWIGIYPGELPSEIEALAPPIFGRVQLL